MQLDVWGAHSLPPRWTLLLIPHRFFIGDAFEVLAAVLDGAGWNPIEADALTQRCQGLRHGPGWLHQGNAANHDGSFLPLLRVAKSGYTLLRGDKEPHRTGRVEVGRSTGSLLHTTLGMPQSDAVDAGWFHTDYHHAFTHSAHASLEAQRRALALGPKAIATLHSHS
jgi:hypothetical protein